MQGDHFLKKLKHDLHEEFEIVHTTIQLERKGLDDSLKME
jgi:Co/Zn/Cd efflux system component